MILFYSKKTGEIVGTVEGRIHNEDQLRIWIGSKEENEQLVVEYVKIGENVETYFEDIYEEYIDKDGFTEQRVVGKKKKKRIVALLEPNHKQKDLFELFDKQSMKVYEYKIDLNSKELVKK